MIKHVLLFVLAFAFSAAAFAQVTQLAFPPLRSVGMGAGHINGLATDAAGHVFTAQNNNFYDAINPDTSLSLIQKYTANGNLLWACRVFLHDSSSTARSLDVAADAAGNSYLYGAYSGDSVQLVGGPLLPDSAGNDFFVAKYRSSGALLWVRPFHASTNTRGGRIVADPAGNFVITGTGITAGQYAFGNGVSLTINQAPGSAFNNFIVKFSAGGDALWAEYLFGLLEDVEMSPTGEVFLSGRVSPQTLPLIVGTTTFPQTHQRLFLVKLNPSGALAWTKTPDTSGGWLHRITIGADGAIFALASQMGGLTINGISVPSGPLNASQIFVTKFLSTGQLEWARPFMLDSVNYGFIPGDITADSSGNILVTLSPQMPISGPAVPYNHEAQLYLCKLDQNGNLIWNISGGSRYQDHVTELAMGKQNSCYLAFRTNEIIAPVHNNQIIFGGLPVTTINDSIEDWDDSFSRVFKIDLGPDTPLVSLLPNMQETHVQVYPNPNRGKFMIRLQGVNQGAVLAELRNVLGQIVWQQKIASESGIVQREVSISNLSKGIYYLQLSVGSEIGVQKVVIE